MHNLSIKDGKAEMFCVGQPAWHGLGNNIPQHCNGLDALKFGGLNWEVEKLQLSNPKNSDLINSWGIFRADNNAFLGNVGSDYQPIQNSKMVETIDTLLTSWNGCHYESGGALGIGETVWVMAKIPEQIKVGNDISENYIFFSNSHNGKSFANVKLTSTRIVCQNTLSIALKDAGKVFRIQHSKNCNIRIDQTLATIGSVSNQIKDLNSVFNILNSKLITMDEFNNILRCLFPVTSEVESSTVKLKKDLVTGLFESNDRNAFPEQRGTAYNLLNAVTGYADHLAPARGENDDAKQLKRQTAAMFGAGEVLKLTALFELSKICKITSQQFEKLTNKF